MLNVLGGDGCSSDTVKQQLVIGSFPAADFEIDTLTACTNNEIKFKDVTNLEVGNKNY